MNIPGSNTAEGGPAMRAVRMLAFTSAGLALPLPALAHHPMGGAAPATLLEGVLSGVAHPVIGLDHFAFLIAAGFLAGAAREPRASAALPAFLVAGLAGAALFLAGIGLGPVEAVVAFTTLALGALLLGRSGEARLRPGLLTMALAAAGLFHGQALAEAVEGSPGGVVVAYLLTLVLVQGFIGIGAALLRRHLSAPVRQLAGAGAAGVGAIALVMALAA